MKRQGNLIDAIADRDNLLRAFVRARRGHSRSAAAVAFARNLETNVQTLRAGILVGDVPLGRLHRFEIRDPKPRVIHAPDFVERVLHHAIMHHCEPRLERYLIDDTFACRTGRGTSAAVARAQQFVRRYRFVLKLDIARYFDSIDHDVLVGMLARLWRDRRLLALLERVVRCFAVAPGKGLPIGALTSQHFANLYLGRLDHHVKNDLRCPGYVRYMDDFLLFEDDRDRLRSWLRGLHEWLRDELRLTIKAGCQLLPTADGVPFLGLRVSATHLRLGGGRKRRLARRVRGLARAFSRGGVGEREYAARLQAVFLHAEQVQSLALRTGLLARLHADGLPVCG